MTDRAQEILADIEKRLHTSRNRDAWWLDALRWLLAERKRLLEFAPDGCDEHCGRFPHERRVAPIAELERERDEALTDALRHIDAWRERGAQLASLTRENERLEAQLEQVHAEQAEVGDDMRVLRKRCRLLEATLRPLVAFLDSCQWASPRLREQVKALLGDARRALEPTP